MSNERIKWIDIAKGLGIYFIVFGHISPSSAISKYIYSFHVPLFFFLSGYVFNFDKLKDANIFLKKKTSSLLIPYFSFSFITFIFFFTLKLVGFDYFKITNTTINQFFLSIINGFPVNINGPLWFLTCLFITELIFYFICRLKYKLPNIIISILLITIVGFISFKFIDLILPWNLQIAFISVSFFGIGYIFNNYIIHKIHLSKMSYVLVLFLAFVTNIFVSGINERVDVINKQYGNIFLFYLGAFSGIAFVIILSSFLSNISIIYYCGKNSLIILCSHKFFLIFFMLLFNNLGLNSLLQIKFVNLIYTAFILISISPLIYFINNYAPFLIGKINSINIK